MLPSNTSKTTQNTLGQHKGQKEKKNNQNEIFFRKMLYLNSAHFLNYLKFRFSRMYIFILPLSIISEGKEKN